MTDLINSIAVLLGINRDSGGRVRLAGRLKRPARTTRGEDTVSISPEARSRLEDDHGQRGAEEKPER